jgi:cell division protein FtsB
VTSRRFIVFLYVVLLTGFGVWAGALLVDARAEYAQLKKIQVSNEVRLAEAERRLREQERILQRMRTDPEYVEKAIRKNLSYARSTELIFSFDPDL